MRIGSKKAFTLFELLITLIVITIIAGFGYYSLAKTNQSRALEKGAEMLHSMVRVARTQAITNGTYARLIINNDSSDPDAYLRKIGVMVQDDDQDKYWRAVERGSYLPSGVFLVPQSGSVTFPTGLPKSIYRKVNNDTQDGASVYYYDYQLVAPVIESTTTNPSWICIQFAPNGRLSPVVYDGGGLVPLSNQLIVAKGNWSNGAVDFESPPVYVGISFKRGGSTYLSQESELFEYEEGKVEDAPAEDG